MRRALTIGLLVATAAALAACVPPLPAGELGGQTGGVAPGSGRGGAAAGGPAGSGDPDAGAPSSPVTLVARAGQPRNLAVDGSVYWVNRGAKFLMSIPESGSGAPSPRANVNSRDAWVAAYGGIIYWSDGANGVATDIVALPAGGGQPTTIVSGTQTINQIAANAAGVFWTTAAGTVMKIGLNGGAPTMVASSPGSAGAIAVDAAKVYWTSGSSLFAIGIAGGGSPIELAGEAGSSSIAVDVAHVYWIAPATTHVLSLDGPTPDGPIMKVTINGGRSMLAFNYEYSLRATCLATGGDRVYYGDIAGTAHIVAPAAGFEWAVRAGGAPATSIAVGTNSVYWTLDAPVDSIMAAPR